MLIEPSFNKWSTLWSAIMEKMPVSLILIEPLTCWNQKYNRKSENIESQNIDYRILPKSNDLFVYTAI